MKVALVHDYLREYGGAERVVEALHEIFPDAPIFTAYFNPTGLGPHAQRIKKWDIRTSWMQNLPWANKLISPFRIFAPMAFESFNFSEYDTVISSCNIYFAKAVITKPKTLHISYIHTPPRYLYGFTTSFNYKKNPLTNLLGELANHFLRLYDFETSQRPDVLVANSKNVAERIKKFYRRGAVIIYPPIDIGKFKSQTKRHSGANAVSDRIQKTDPIGSIKSTLQDDGVTGSYFLSVGRLVRGKGVEVILEACAKLNLSLKVVGIGPLLEILKNQFSKIDRSQAPLIYKNIEFLGQVEDEKMPGIYAGAKATIIASEDEDFGIVPVESMASGTPVIAVKAGGFLETVIEGKTGVFFEKATPESLIEVLEKFDHNKFKEEDCIKQADKFSKSRFKKEIINLIKKYA